MTFSEETKIGPARPSEVRSTVGRLAFLAAASEVLAASLDLPETLSQVVHLAVPELADICSIELLAADGRLELAAIADTDREAEEVLRIHASLAGYADDPAYPPRRVVSSGRPVLVPEVPAHIFEQFTKDPDQLEFLLRHRAGTGMSVPLQARGRILGSLSLARMTGKAAYDEEDLILAVDLGHRAALAIDSAQQFADNARLLAERSHVATVLQRSLLPATLPEIPGVDLAARYRAVGEGLEVGGDFYDAVYAGDDRWVLAVGDVSGKGAEAAALTGLVRHSLGALARHLREPQPIVRAVHDILIAETAGDENYCTLVCAVLHPDARGASLSVVCAGHPPPLIRRADGSVVEVPSRGGLLGAFADTAIPEPTIVRLDRGDVVVFYTDGVTEARRADGIFGEARLRSAVQSAGGDACSVADAVLAAVDDYALGEPHDDLAVLAVGVPRDA
jgi:serine phosphatase RsbU (regulator of sigma subunit)